MIGAITGVRTCELHNNLKPVLFTSPDPRVTGGKNEYK